MSKSDTGAIDGFGFGGEIGEALGLKDTTRIEILIPLYGPIVIKATMNMDREQAEGLKRVLAEKRYHLAERGMAMWQCDECGETFDDDGSGKCPFCGCSDKTEYDEDDDDLI